MTYATQQNMLDRFGEREMVALSDRENTGVVDADVVTAALESADGEINAYISARYTLPMVNVPVIVRDFACDIARYRLCGAEVTETEEVRDRYNDAIKFFVNVSKGVVKLGVDAEGDKAVPSGGVKTSSPSRVFNDKSMDGY